MLSRGKDGIPPFESSTAPIFDKIENGQFCLVSNSELAFVSREAEKPGEQLRRYINTGKPWLVSFLTVDNNFFC
jgi:hypothetical protein